MITPSCIFRMPFQRTIALQSVGIVCFLMLLAGCASEPPVQVTKRVSASCVAEALFAVARTEKKNLDWRFELTSSGSLNASPADNGTIRLSAELLNYGQTQGQTAVMIAHEIAHVLSNDLNRVNAKTSFSEKIQIETQADLHGLTLMARAGFDPNESIGFWRNIQEAGIGRPVRYPSDYPEVPVRIANLISHLEDAETVFEQARRSGRNPVCD